ncbi:MAG: hypothetical protein HZC01_04855 [Candidatus Kerfeldbacteria bacterium]|nr:hypothetical protein [Candidatus Kerfeldbacteria bacterium]
MNVFLKLFLIILILASLGGAVLLIYQGQPLPLLNRVITIPFLEKDPERILSESIRLLEEATTATYRLTRAQSVMIADQGVTFNMTVVHQGQLYPQWRGTSSILAEFDLQGVRFRMAAEARATDEWVYLGFQEFPAIPFLDIRTLDGAWYRFPNRWQTHTQNHQPLRMTDYITSLTRDADVTLNNNQMYQLKGVMDVRRAFEEWGIPLSQSAESVPVVVFIGKNDHRLYRLEIGTGLTQAMLTISDYGQTVSVTEPTEARPFEIFWSDLFVKTNTLDLPLFGSLLGINIGSDASDDDNDGLYLIWERLFGTDPFRADTDGDGYTDSEELKNGYNPHGSNRIVPFPLNENIR